MLADATGADMTIERAIVFVRRARRFSKRRVVTNARAAVAT
jgi:hypothetical protein